MAQARLFASLALTGLMWILALLALSAPAHAQQRPTANAPGGWQLCNETSFVLEAATGKPNGSAIQVRGWLRLRPGQCVIAAATPLVRGKHYVFARTSLAHRGGRRQWGGDSKLCVDRARSFEGNNPSTCSELSFEERGFREVQINKRDSWRTSFAEATPYTIYGARTAGIQRLLADAGYDTRAASGGIDARRAQTAIQRFRAEVNLPTNATEDQIIDELERRAQRRSNQIGLQLCNRTPGKLWTAIARRRGEGWESRGWWSLPPGDCARTIDEPLLQGTYFVHAVMESAQGDRYLASGGDTFCTSPSRFAILGRENCGARYYDVSVFAGIASEGREGLIVDFRENEFLKPGVKPEPTGTAQATPDLVAPASSSGPVAPGGADADTGATIIRPQRLPGVPNTAAEQGKGAARQRPGAVLPATPRQQNPALRPTQPSPAPPSAPADSGAPR
jgi:uncharacterized membrane protein